MKVKTAIGALILFSLMLISCGGGGSGTTTPPSNPPAPAPVNIAGQWQILAHSQVHPTGYQSYLLVGANLSQTGSAVSSSPQNTAIVSLFPGLNWQLGAACGGGQLGNTSIDASISNATNLSFTLSESGDYGSNVVTGTGAISSDGQTIIGTYTAPVGCNAPSDAGTFTASKVNLSGTYSYFAGMYGEAPEGTVTVTQGANYTVNATGTIDGSTLILSGDVTGGMFSVNGTLNGNPVSYIGVLVPTGFDLAGRVIVLDPSTQALIGSLQKTGL